MTFRWFRPRPGAAAQDSEHDDAPDTLASVASTLLHASAAEEGELDVDRLVDDLMTEVRGPSHLPQIGDVIGNVYRIDAELGRGAMGVVFLAFDLQLRRKVALKLVNARALTPQMWQRFVAEARAMARVSHANVVAIHSFGEHESTPYFVMDLVEGQDADAWLDATDRAPDIDLALDIIADVCAGVSAIHAAGAIHRDLKPTNVLLDSNLRARVADLGLAVSYIEGGVMREIAGTPEYMAPEIASGEGHAASPLSDVYALGCLAYELLTGTRPFDAETPLGLLAQHATVKPTPPSARRPGLPVAFDRVILKALEKRPENRAASADWFRRSIKEARASSLEPVRILVAEDDPDFRDLLAMKLGSEFPGADILCVDNGQALLDAFQEKPASVVMIDLGLPVLDGVAVTTLLRARADAENVPIIVLTASGGPEDWKLLVSLGADRFLVKPVHLDDVVTTVRNAVRERSSTFPPPVMLKEAWVSDRQE